MVRKIAIDMSPTTSGHSIRGIGVHTTELIKSMQELNDPSFDICPVDFSSQGLSGYDLVHYPYFHPYFLTLPPKGGKKSVVTIHDLIYLLYPDHYPSGIKGKLRFLMQKRRLRNME